MANYADLYWQVRSEVPGVPTPILYNHFAEAVREFFVRSLAWQHNCPNALNLAASTAFPTLITGTDIPTASQVVQPTRIKWSDGTFIPFKTRDQMDEIDAKWEQTTGSTSSYWTITGPGSFRLYPLLTALATARIYLRVALAPTVAGGAVPDALVYEFQDAWTHGALARLLRIPGKDWTNPNLAATYMQMYDADIKLAKSRAAADFGRPHRTVEYGGLAIGGSGRQFNDGDYGR